MNLMKIGLVTTTIHIPTLLRDLAQIGLENSLKDLFFVVAGDTKTPGECKNFCRKVQSDYGYETIYLDVEKQEREYPKLSKYIPYKSISRRDFAILKAYEIMADTIIMVDDDNFPVLGSNYFEKHSIVGSETYLNIVSSSNNWYNVCETLLERNGSYIYHRGYPFGKREKAVFTTRRERVKIAVNEGLWIEAPDTDAVSWLNYPNLTIVDFHERLYGKTFGVSNDTWVPINSQNTAIMREAVPSYFLNPNHKRYDDIWAGYIFEKVAKHLGFTITFGEPLVEQRRNPHDYTADLLNEIDGMRRTPLLIAELENIELNSKTFIDATAELMMELSDDFLDIKKGYEVWLDYF